MTTYSYRPYSVGDEAGINALYEMITGRRRTKEQWEWQWLAAPGGQGEIWIIEADEDGGKKLIGHHGVMPVRFSLGEHDLLFGKTENTFVHPDYRDKILYPRFETRFRSHYESRFSALFSTAGPSAAIRQRQAQGYESSRKWVNYLWAVNYGRSLRLCGSYVARKFGRWESTNGTASSNPLFGPRQITLDGVKIAAHRSAEAKQLNFFDGFWSSIRKKYPVTTSRRSEDLRWRFWDNPNVEYTTLVLDSEAAGAGVAIVRGGRADQLVIEDFYVELCEARAYNHLLNAVLKWASRSRVACVQFKTTDDSLEWLGVGTRRLSRYFNGQPLFDRFSKAPVDHMPRKICKTDSTADLTGKEWYTTGIVGQGIE